jgi:hypothetical protein
MNAYADIPTGNGTEDAGPEEEAEASSVPGQPELEQRLRPGRWSPLGFLGADESLDAVIAQDAETVARLGVSYDAMADALGQVMTTTIELFRTPVPPDRIDEVLAHQTFFPDFSHPETIPHFDLENLPDPKSGFMIGDLQVFLVNYKDWQSCPWGCHAYSSNDFMIVNRQTGDTVTGPELMPHFIRMHHFFGGRESPYRTDPEQLARVLELVGTT